MKKKILTLSLLIIIKIYQITTQSISCSTFKTCISCSMNRNCIWMNSKCGDSESSKLIIKWYEPFQNCLTDEKTKDDMLNYCGPNTINDISKSVFSNNYNGFYLPENKELYCEIKINSKASDKLKIEFEGENIFKSMELYNEGIKHNIKQYSSLHYYFPNNEEYIVNLKEKYQVKIKNVNRMVFRFLIFDNSTETNQNNYKNPFFNLKIKYDKKISSYTRSIIIVIIILSILFIFIFILVIFYIKRKNEENNINNSNNNSNNNQITQSEYNTLSKNKLLLEKKLKYFKYKSIDHEKLFNTTCTICFENFSDNSNIIALSCEHAFHSECIIKWLEATLEQPICPNCKSNVLA